VKTATKLSLCLALVLLAGQSFAGQKFESLAEFNQVHGNHIVLDMPWLEPVLFQGYLNAGTVSSNSYNTPYYDAGIGAAGPAIQILAQVIGTKSARNRKYAKAQAEADQVLAEHTDMVQAISHEDLYLQFKQQALIAEHSVEVFTPDKNELKFFIALEPVFTISQDKSSMMLNNKVQIYSRKKPKKPVFTQEFIVVSESISTDQIDDYWRLDSKENFLDLSKYLFARSTELMLAAMVSESIHEGKQKTFKYKFGNETRYERATQVRYQHLDSSCDRTLVTTLASNLMSLPSASLGCEEP